MRRFLLVCVVGYLAGCGGAELGLRLAARYGARVGTTAVEHYR